MIVLTQALPLQVPNPTEQDIADTDACVASCPKGDGGEAAAQVYSECLTECINDNFLLTSTTGSSSPTSGSTTDSAGNSESTDDSSSDSTDGSDSTEGSDSGAGSLAVSTTAFGLAAFLVGFVSL